MIDLTETPQRLKQSILMEAMQGKLTKQLPSDGNASDLLKSIQQKKQEVVKAKKIRRHKPLKPVSKDEVPFEIPSNWKWTRLGNISLLNAKITDNSTSSKFLIKVSDMYLDGNNLYVKCSKNFKLSSKRLLEPSILFPKRGGAIKTNARRILLNKNSITDPNMMCLTPVDNSMFKYIWILFKSINLYKLKEGTSIPEINQKDVCRVLIPLPPLSEQKRIVHRLNQILPKIDELSKSVTKLHQLHAAFLHRIKQSLLRAAMQGKLTQQRPSDGNASDLLKSIRQRKQQLVKAKKIKRQKPLPPVKTSEIPFAIPRNWRWTRLGCIGSWKAGSNPLKSHKEYYDNGTIPYLRSGDIVEGYIYKTSEKISKIGLEKNSLRLNPKGSIVMAMIGATIAKPGILGISATTNTNCCACILYGNMSNKFIFYYLLSERNYFINIESGGAQPSISRTNIIHYLIPIPPLLEQKRIVSKLNNLFREI